MSLPRDAQIVYPPGVKELVDNISTDELVRRLIECAKAFQNLSQDEDNSAYIPLALHFVSEFFLEHQKNDVRLLAACCIADVFRVYAPDAPYKDAALLKVIFQFFIQQLHGLNDSDNPSFKRVFYLLENVSCVRTFNICFELDNSQEILCDLFKLMFKIISGNNTTRVIKFIQDMLHPILSESDVISSELIEILLRQIVEPVKSKSENAYELAVSIIKTTSTSLEPSIQSFFNNVLHLGVPIQKKWLAAHFYDLIYELNCICPTLMVRVIPQLETKLKSNDEEERKQVCRIIARMFSEKHSRMIEENDLLWTSFISRFNDISPKVRAICVEYSKHLMLNQPESREALTEQLKKRCHDVDEDVRFTVIETVIEVARTNLECIDEDQLELVKERTLDKQFKIRKAALMGLAQLYQEHVAMKKSFLDSSYNAELLSWIKNKVFHAYYQSSIDDKLLVERILNTCLVPFTSTVLNRMKMLYKIFCSVDENACKAFKELLRCQRSLRSNVSTILRDIHSTGQMPRDIMKKLETIANNVQNNKNTVSLLLKFFNEINTDIKLRSLMSTIIEANATSREVENKLKEVLRTLGQPVQSNLYYAVIKQLLERIAPILIDRESTLYLLEFVNDSLLGRGEIDRELELRSSPYKGLDLLLTVSQTYPRTFHQEKVYRTLIGFLQSNDDEASNVTLQILKNVCADLEVSHPEISRELLNLLINFAVGGHPRNAKHAVHCINIMVADRVAIFENILERVEPFLNWESQYFRTALVSTGIIAELCHDHFATHMKNVVSNKIVQNVLAHDEAIMHGGNELWCSFENLPSSCQVKISSIKVMVRWLIGLKTMVNPALSTFRLLATIIAKGGDLTNRQLMAPYELSWMRVAAARSMLKLSKNSDYANALPAHEFQTLAYVMTDPCENVRDIFAQKLHKASYFLHLPAEFLSFFCLAALSDCKKFKEQAKRNLLLCINAKREKLKERKFTNAELLKALPDYALTHAVYILTHASFFGRYDEVPALLKIRECLIMLIDSLTSKNESYSFAFYKRLLENIKQTKVFTPDAASTETRSTSETDKKMYAVCDVALHIIQSKQNITERSFPAEPVLDPRFFTSPDPEYKNMITYLPAKYFKTVGVKARPGFEIQQLDSVDQPSTSGVAGTASNDRDVRNKPSVSAASQSSVSSSSRNVASTSRDSVSDSISSVIQQEERRESGAETSRPKLGATKPSNAVPVSERNGNVSPIRKPTKVGRRKATEVTSSGSSTVSNTRTKNFRDLSSLSNASSDIRMNGTEQPMTSTARKSKQHMTNFRMSSQSTRSTRFSPTARPVGSSAAAKSKSRLVSPSTDRSSGTVSEVGGSIVSPPARKSSTRSPAALSQSPSSPSSLLSVSLSNTSDIERIVKKCYVLLKDERAVPNTAGKKDNDKISKKAPRATRSQPIESSGESPAEKFELLPNNKMVRKRKIDNVKSSSESLKKTSKPTKTQLLQRDDEHLLENGDVLKNDSAVRKRRTNGKLLSEPQEKTSETAKTQHVAPAVENADVLKIDSAGRKRRTNGKLISEPPKKMVKSAKNQPNVLKEDCVPEQCDVALQGDQTGKTKPNAAKSGAQLAKTLRSTRNQPSTQSDATSTQSDSSTENFDKRNKNPVLVNGKQSVAKKVNKVLQIQKVATRSTSLNRGRPSRR